MLKRSYLVLSLVAILGISGALALGSAAFADEQKDKEKAEQDQQKEKEKEKESALFSEYATALSGFGGSSSYLGVYLEEVTSDRAKELKLTEERGAVVMKVVEGSPAEKAGLKENDVITSFNGRRIDTVRELQRLLGETPAGRNVQFEVIRGGSHQTFSATVTRRSPQVGIWKQGLFDEEAMKRNQRLLDETLKRSQEMTKLGEKGLKGFKDFGDFNFVAPGKFMFYRGSRLGIGVESLTDQLAEYFGVKGGHGVLVAEVKENSAAAKAGLKAGDVITAIDGQKVDDVSALLEATSKKEEGTVTVTIVRNRTEQSITLTLEKPERRSLQTPRPRARVIASGVSVSL